MRIKIIILFIIIILVINQDLFSQCSCLGGATMGGITAVTGTTNVGVLKKNNIRASVFYSYTYGNKYFEKDSKLSNGFIKDFKTSYLGFIVAYGIIEDLTIETELYSFLNKSADYRYYKLSSSGLSHFAVNLKYNIVSLRSKEIEWTFAAGAKIPANNNNESDLPQQIQSSSGEYGIIFQSFLHKGFKKHGLHFILYNKLEHSFENIAKYQYGMIVNNSLFITKSFLKNLSGIFELRNDIRLKDKEQGNEIEDTGSNSILVAPQISFSFLDFDFTLMGDYPIYKYYSGKQLSKEYSIGFGITWQGKIF